MCCGGGVVWLACCNAENPYEHEPLWQRTGFSAQKTDLMLEAQTLWDATMAHSLATAAVSPEAAVNGAASILLDSHGDKGTKRPLIVHVCGKFHCNPSVIRLSSVPCSLCRPVCSLFPFSPILTHSTFAHTVSVRLACGPEPCSASTGRAFAKPGARACVRQLFAQHEQQTTCMAWSASTCTQRASMPACRVFAPFCPLRVLTHPSPAVCLSGAPARSHVCTVFRAAHPAPTRARA